MKIKNKNKNKIKKNKLIMKVKKLLFDKKININLIFTFISLN